MGLVTLTVLIGILSFAYVRRETGIPIAVNTTVDVWGHIIDDRPSHEFLSMLSQNLILWITLYTLAYLALYKTPVVKAWKLNPDSPNAELMRTEVFRSVRGVTIASIWEYAIHQLFSSRNYVPPLCLSVLKVPDGGPKEMALVTVVTGGLILYVWGDFHFYWSHRLLHSPWLYKNVHKYHHQSYNPNPFSGLSMHWFESTVYFSAAPMASVAAPLWMCRMLLKGLIIFPLEGHSGFGSWDDEGTYNHYIHHAKFNWNFGSSPLWDHVMGTNWVAPTRGKHEVTTRDKEALIQAEQAGFQGEAVVAQKAKDA